MIEGVEIVQLKQIHDDRGRVMHMLKSTDPHFEKFGEIYFSVVNPGVIKAWHLHSKMIINYAVVFGNIKLVLYDQRENSSTKGEIMEIVIGDKNYALVKVPVGVTNGFQGLGDKPSIVANCANIPHDPEEIVRINPESDAVPYDWSFKHR